METVHVTTFNKKARFHLFLDCEELQKTEDRFIHTMDRSLAKGMRIFTCEYCKERSKKKKDD
jgi:hypothetical protein